MKLTIRAPLMLITYLSMPAAYRGGAKELWLEEIQLILGSQKI